jgi:hypothetical protein
MMEGRTKMNTELQEETLEILTQRASQCVKNADACSLATDTSKEGWVFFSIAEALWTIAAGELRSNLIDSQKIFWMGQDRKED